MSLTFEWDDEMATGIEEIDRQHRDFLELGKRAEKIMKKKSRIEEDDVIDLHSSLARYLDLHCRDEEKLMEEIHYKRISQHKEAHRDFIDRIKSYDMSKFREDPLMQVIQMSSFIQEIIWDHIYENDKDLAKEYRRYLKLFKHMEDAKQEERAANEKKFGVPIKEDNMTIAYLMWDQTYKGNAILVNKEKNTNLLRLSSLEFNTFNRDLIGLMRAIQRTFNPDNIEVVSMSDVDKQFCIHVVPKYKSDPDYGKIFSIHEDFERWDKEEYVKLASKIAKNY